MEKRFADCLRLKYILCVSNDRVRKSGTNTTVTRINLCRSYIEVRKLSSFEMKFSLEMGRYYQWNYEKITSPLFLKNRTLIAYLDSEIEESICCAFQMLTCVIIMPRCSPFPLNTTEFHHSLQLLHFSQYGDRVALLLSHTVRYARSHK